MASKSHEQLFVKINNVELGQARLEERLSSIHEDMREMREDQKKFIDTLAKTDKTCDAHSTWIDDHDAMHKGYFNKTIAILTVIAAVIALGWNMLIDLAKVLLGR